MAVRPVAADVILIGRRVVQIQPRLGYGSRTNWGTSSITICNFHLDYPQCIEVVLDEVVQQFLWPDAALFSLDARRDPPQRYLFAREAHC